MADGHDFSQHLELRDLLSDFRIRQSELVGRNAAIESPHLTTFGAGQPLNEFVSGKRIFRARGDHPTPARSTSPVDNGPIGLLISRDKGIAEQWLAIFTNLGRLSAISQGLGGSHPLNPHRCFPFLQRCQDFIIPVCIDVRRDYFVGKQQAGVKGQRCDARVVVDDGLVVLIQDISTEGVQVKHEVPQGLIGFCADYGPVDLGRIIEGFRSSQVFIPGLRYCNPFRFQQVLTIPHPGSVAFGGESVGLSIENEGVNRRLVVLDIEVLIDHVRIVDELVQIQERIGLDPGRRPI